MWTWFGIAILARVLMANHDVGQYQSTNFVSDQMTEDSVKGGESAEPQEELSSRQSTLKPGIKSSMILQWKDDHIFQDVKTPYESSINNLIQELGPSGPKVILNTPKNLKDQRDKRSSIKSEEDQPSGTWISWAYQKNKALPFRNLQGSWQEMKKSQLFSPWGGKRVTVYDQGPKVRRPIRVPFNSWGGKRSFTGDEKKRTKFSSWGGKRDWYIGAEEAAEKGEEKRTKFNAWGGKRSKNGERDDEEIKRNRFNAWGGKRSEKTNKRTPEDLDVKKNVFNAWGGKRYFTENEVHLDEENRSKYDRNMYDAEKTPGKENMEVESIMDNGENGVEEVEEEGENISDENRNEVSIERGIIELPEKKRGSRDDYIHRSSFNPWGGRKRGENDIDNIETGLNLILPESHHHHTRFWSWGG